MKYFIYSMLSGLIGIANVSALDRDAVENSETTAPTTLTLAMPELKEAKTGGITIPTETLALIIASDYFSKAAEIPETIETPEIKEVGVGCITFTGNMDYFYKNDVIPGKVIFGPDIKISSNNPLSSGNEPSTPMRTNEDNKNID